jgi:hypothetical protein
MFRMKQPISHLILKILFSKGLENKPSNLDLISETFRNLDTLY